MLTALNAGQTGMQWTTGSFGYGCMLYWGEMYGLATHNNPTTCEAAISGYSRACACNS